MIIFPVFLRSTKFIVTTFGTKTSFLSTLEIATLLSIPITSLFSITIWLFSIFVSIYSVLPSFILTLFSLLGLIDFSSSLRHPGDSNITLTGKDPGLVLVQSTLALIVAFQKYNSYALALEAFSIIILSPP